MRKAFLTLIVAAAFLSSCNQKGTTPEAEAVTPPVPEAINLKLTDLATDKDLVCGMPVEEGSIADTASYEGKVYGFCAAECKQAFLAEPSKYLAQQQ